MTTVLSFPQRNKGRVRKSNNVYSMGETSLNLARRSGMEVPAQVRFLREPPAPRQSATPEQALLIALYAAVSDDQRAMGKVQLKCMAMAGDQQAKQALSLLMEPHSTKSS